MCDRSIYCSLLVLPMQQHQIQDSSVGTLWSGEGGRLCFSCFPQAVSLFWPQSPMFICIVYIYHKALCSSVHLPQSTVFFCIVYTELSVLESSIIYFKPIFIPKIFISSQPSGVPSKIAQAYAIIYFSMSSFTRNICAKICSPNTVSLEFFGPIQRCVLYIPLCIRVHWTFSNLVLYCIP